MGRYLETPSTRLGKLIDQGLRRSNLFDQSSLAVHCGVDKSYLAKVRLGRIAHPNESVLFAISLALGQDIEEYRSAVLADNGMLPRWERVLGSQLADQEGVRLSSENVEDIARYARSLVRRRRGKL